MGNWINFLRKYGPIPRNDNMYDEAIQRTSRRSKIDPIAFEHPFQKDVFACFDCSPLSNVILTGTAGDGKTHLCRQVWEKLGGDLKEWGSDDPYVCLEYDGKSVHFIRDLSGWAPPMGHTWEDHPEKKKLILQFVESCFEKGSDNVFMIAGNDGQLVEAFRRLSMESESAKVIEFRNVLDELLVEDKQFMEGVFLELFNLSRGSTTEIFDRALDAFIHHDGWTECLSECDGRDNCPVRINYNLLKTDIVRTRIRKLFELCDHNGLHLPIRQVLLLLTNSVLGHPDAKDSLIREADIIKILDSGKVAEGCLYSNVFGGNIPYRRRNSITVFDYFERFQIGEETTNRIDNLLIFGEDDDSLKPVYDDLFGSDPFFSNDVSFRNAKKMYIEASDEDEEVATKFLDMLVRYRRGMFFMIPVEKEQEYKLWDLTVFHFAGEYTNDVFEFLADGNKFVHGKILGRLVRGLNRIFTGMMLDSNDKLYLAVSGSYSQSKVSRIFLDYVSVRPSKGEKMTIIVDDNKYVVLRVFFTPSDYEDLKLSLVRYEFLSRVAEDGALPASFSKECNEDILAFKSRLIARWNNIRNRDVKEIMDDSIEIRILSSESGKPKERTIAIRK